MPSIRQPESIGTLTRASATTASLGASRINVGPFQYLTTSPLTLNAATTGAGGLDTGALAANSLYYVHAVISSGAVALIGSLSKTAPTGFTTFRWTSQAFVTNASSQISQAGTLAGLRTIQTFLSGSSTYTPSIAVTSLRVRMVGGGGGGGGGSNGANGGGGGNSTFGTSLLVANGGAGGQLGSNSGGNLASGGAGGSASFATGPTGIAIAGSYGGGGIYVASGNVIGPGGSGGSSPFGGAGGGWQEQVGFAAAVNSGSGGAGGSNTAININSGGGGGSGGYVDAIITPIASTYTYSVGASGSAGAGGTSGTAGGAGGSGVIIVEEFYA